jgi:hypothetical protein
MNRYAASVCDEKRNRDTTILFFDSVLRIQYSNVITSSAST